MEKKNHKAKKQRPHKIITTEAKDGSFGHEHIYHGHSVPVFAGTSKTLDDLKQHMDDHFGPGAGVASPEEEAEAAPAAAPEEMETQGAE